MGIPEKEINSATFAFLAEMRTVGVIGTGKVEQN